MSAVPLNHTIDRCRACPSAALTPLYGLGDQYVNDFPARWRERDGPRCPIEIVLCRGCGLVQQRHSAPNELLYRRHYWYRSGVTATMRDALAGVAAEATRRARLRPGDWVLDIGSNDGTLLRSYPPGIVTVGVEPAENLAAEGSQGIDRFVGAFWSRGAWEELFPPSNARRLARVVTALGMLYDLEDPLAFLRDVAAVLHPRGLFIAQLMCLHNMVRTNDLGNLCHEHLEFYSLACLENLLNRCGLGICDVETNDVNGQSYRLYITHTRGPEAGVYWQTPGSADRVAEAYAAERRCGYGGPTVHKEWFETLQRNRDRCLAFLDREVRNGGKRCWVYGASTKGNTILQWYGLGPQGWDTSTPTCAGWAWKNGLIEAAAERSPGKWGKVTVGTGIPIRSEDDFRRAAPDYALVLPYAFLPEFLERERAWLAGGGKFIVPLPEFKVIGVNGDCTQRA